MKGYLRKRYKTYVSVAFGLLTGFIGATFLFDEPDFKYAVFVAVSFGLIVGELLVFSKWSKDQKKE